jgi:hypothetical protein
MQPDGFDPMVTETSLLQVYREAKGSGAAFGQLIPVGKGTESDWGVFCNANPTLLRKRRFRRSYYPEDYHSDWGNVESLWCGRPECVDPWRASPEEDD